MAQENDTHKGETITLTDGAFLHRQSFRRCSIIGPATLDIRSTIVFGCRMTQDPAYNDRDVSAFTYSDLWPPDDLPIVRVFKCEFMDCELENVWLWAPQSNFPKSRIGQWRRVRRMLTRGSDRTVRRSHA